MTAAGLPVVEMYAVEGCHLCDVARDILLAVREEEPFVFAETVIDPDHKRYAEYRDKVPVVIVNGREAAYWRITADELRKHLCSGSSNSNVA